MTSLTSSDARSKTQPALHIHKLSKRFSGSSKPVWNDITFSIAAGDSVAIIGGNGTGKSTLLRCCLRLIEPDSGEIHLHGRQITEVKRHELRRLRSHVGFVFQKHNLVPRLSVLTNVLHGSMARTRGIRQWHHSLALRQDRECAMDCLEQVSLAHLAGQRADRLSGGQSQRVAIARALMQRPKMIFADEPVASLDPQAGEEVMNTFAKLSKDHGLTLMFVSHNLDHALQYSSRILGLKDGRLFLDTPSGHETSSSLRCLYE